MCNMKKQYYTRFFFFFIRKKTLESTRSVRIAAPSGESLSLSFIPARNHTSFHTSDNLYTELTMIYNTVRSARKIFIKRRLRGYVCFASLFCGVIINRGAERQQNIQHPRNHGRLNNIMYIIQSLQLDQYDHNIYIYSAYIVIIKY